MIKRIRLFVRDDENSRREAKCCEEQFIANDFEIVSDNPDLAIAVGGDGTFLRMMKECNFDGNIIYVGINSGTLGFLQEVKLEELSEFISEVKTGYFKLEEIGIQETIVEHKDGNSRFCSLNEIVIRDNNLKVVKLKIKIDDDLLEEFSGDGILVATSVGSTAHNLSYGGSIVYDTFSSLQITPIAPLNTKVYRSLLNSVIIPEKKEISLIPTGRTNNLSIIVDGEQKVFDNVTMVKTSIDSKKIKGWFSVITIFLKK